MKYKNIILFKDVFSFKEVKENHFPKIMTEVSSSSCHQSKDDKFKCRRSKREKNNKNIWS
jgi:hypothetical protein